MFVASTNTIGFNSAGESTNPVTTTVLATTGAKPAGRYLCVVTLACTANAQFDIQRRDSTDASTVSTLTVYVPANDSRQVTIGLALNADERIRVVPNANITGDAVCAINWQRIS